MDYYNHRSVYRKSRRNSPNNKNYNYDNTKIYIKYFVKSSMELMNMIIIFTILNGKTNIKETKPYFFHLLKKLIKSSY